MAQSIGERPSAEAQNEYNRENWDYDLEYRISRRGTIFNQNHSDTKSGVFYYQGQIDGSTFGFRFLIDNRDTISLTNNYMRGRLYDEDDNLIFQIEDDEGSVSVSTSLTYYRDGNYYYISLEANGKYSWNIYSSWTTSAGVNAGYVGAYCHRGQTDIPVGARLRIWAPDFSEIEAEQAREKDGISIDYHTSGRAGYDPEE